jgi:acetyltransferase EpsM
MKNKRLAIIGAGGFAAEVVEAAKEFGWNVQGLYDDDINLLGAQVMGCLCVGKIDDLISASPVNFVMAIGSNKVRFKLADRLIKAGHQPVSVIHPTAMVSRTAKVDDGAFIGAGVFIGPQAMVGAHAIVNVNATVGHDAQIGAFAQVCPGARVSGFVKVGLGAFLGSNASIAPLLQIGEWSRLSAGSFLHRSIPSQALAVGVPARVVDAT